MCGTSKYPSFYQGFLCSHWSMYLVIQQETYTSFPSIYFLLTENLKVSLQRTSKKWEFSLLNSFLSLYVGSPAHDCDLNSHEYVGAFKNHIDLSSSQLFLVSFWSNSCFLPIVFIALVSVMLNYCHWLFLTSDPRKKLFTVSKFWLMSQTLSGGS